MLLIQQYTITTEHVLSYENSQYYNVLRLLS